ncbi:hypothetical protein LEN26_008056 [Aphanomyces euteiches]|nr:hypothetical protein LEN26_008056 [Aphanomyces euteiches]
MQRHGCMKKLIVVAAAWAGSWAVATSAGFIGTGCPYRSDYDVDATILVATEAVCGRRNGTMSSVCLINKRCEVVSRFPSSNASVLQVSSGIVGIGNLSDYPEGLALSVSNCKTPFTLNYALFPPQLVNLTFINCPIDYFEFNTIVWPDSPMSLTMTSCEIANQHYNFPPNVVELRLARNRLDIIPPEVVHRPNLRLLDVSLNNLGAITNMDFSSLSVLILDHNSLQSIRNVCFSELLTRFSADNTTISIFQVSNETYEILSSLSRQGSLVLDTLFTPASKANCDAVQGYKANLGPRSTICIVPPLDMVKQLPSSNDTSKQATDSSRNLSWVLLGSVGTLVLVVAAIYIWHRHKVAGAADKLPTKDTWEYLS